MTETKGTKTGKKEDAEPALPLKPDFDYGDDTFNARALEIWEARDKLHQKTLERSPPIDDKSSKGKKKKKATKQMEASAGRRSANDSQLDMSAAASMSGVTGGETMLMNQTLPAAQPSSKAQKVKPRDFKANPKLLTEIGAANYDTSPDLAELKISLEHKVEKLREQWKCYDPEKLKMLIRKQVILELTRIEERKKVRSDRVELAAKLKAQEDDEDDAEVVALNRSAGSPQKGSVVFQDKSSISSPAKTIKKSFAPSESATDAMSVSMASKASPGAGGFLS